MDQHFWVREDFVFPDVFRVSNFPRIKPVSFLVKSRSSSLRNTWNMKAVQQTAVQTPRSWALRSFSMKTFFSLPIHALLKVKISARWQFLLKFKKRKQTKTGKAGSLLVLILVYFFMFLVYADVTLWLLIFQLLKDLEGNDEVTWFDTISKLSFNL